MGEYEKHKLRGQIYDLEDLIKTLKLALDQAQTTLESLKKLGGDDNDN